MIAPRLVLAATALLAGGALVVGPGAPAYGASSTPSPSPSPSASASSPPKTVTYGMGPSSKGKLDLRTGYTLLSTRGGSIKDEVAVVNLSKVPLTLNLYAVDALNAVDGELGFQPAAADLTDAAKWIKISTPSGKGYVKLAPKQTLYVPFTVKIPKNAPVGDHLAGIVLSSVATGATPGERGSVVTLEQRVALKVAVRVAGELKPKLEIEDLAATYEGSLSPFATGSAVVSYRVRNTGNIRLGGVQQVVVSGLLGDAVNAADVPDVPFLLPGASATITIPVQGVRPFVLMNATVRIFPLSAEGDANPQVDEVTASTVFWAIPWIVLGILLLLLLLLLILLRRRRRGAREPVGRRVRGSGESQGALVR